MVKVRRKRRTLPLEARKGLWYLLLKRTHAEHSREIRSQELSSLIRSSLGFMRRHDDVSLIVRDLKEVDGVVSKLHGTRSGALWHIEAEVLEAKLNGEPVKVRLSPIQQLDPSERIDEIDREIAKLRAERARIFACIRFADA